MRRLLGGLAVATIVSATGVCEDRAAATAALPAGRVVAAVPCVHDPSRTYALYVPEGYTPARRWPVLFCFDARRRGELAVALFREAAERRGYIVLGSNDARSDGPEAPNLLAMEAMLQDARLRFSIDERRLYAAGFSGGARVAARMGARHAGRVAGVIGAAAGLPVDWPETRPIPFAFFGTVGRGDFNYYEMIVLAERLERRGVTHRIEFFDGGHRWPPVELAAEALNWMDLMAMRDGRLDRDPEFIGAQHRATLARAVAAEGAGSPRAALERYLRVVADFSDLLPTQETQRAVRRLQRSASVRRELRREGRRNRRDLRYIVEFEKRMNRLRDPSADLPDPARLILRLGLDSLIARSTDADRHEAQSARRLLETVFVETAFYTPQELLRRGAPAAAAASLDLAIHIRPEDPLLRYEAARAAALAGQPGPALAGLHRALALGFADLERLAADPAFDALRGDPGYPDRLRRRGGD